MDTTVEAANGKHVKAKSVFAHSIKFMKDEAIKLFSDETGDEQFKADDIQWVLTVPAIWTPRAKQFMREAAYEVSTFSTRRKEKWKTKTKQQQNKKQTDKQQQQTTNYYADLANNWLLSYWKSTTGIIVSK